VVVRFGSPADLATVPEIPDGVTVITIGFDTTTWTATVG
jgi:hypothetical protein